MKPAGRLRQKRAEGVRHSMLVHMGGGLVVATPVARSWARARAGGGELRACAMRYLRPSIHSVSACEPRPSAASIAALYPRLAWSLDTTPLVRGISSRSSAQARHSVREAAYVYADERALFRPGQLFLTALHGSKKLGRSGGRKSGTPARRAVCQAGLVETRFPPHALHRRRWPASGTCTVPGSASTLTSALWPQASHVALTAVDAVLAHVPKRHWRPGIAPHGWRPSRLSDGPS